MASTVNTRKNQLLINNLLSYFATDCILDKRSYQHIVFSRLSKGLIDSPYNIHRRVQD